MRSKRLLKKTKKYDKSGSPGAKLKLWRNYWKQTPNRAGMFWFLFCIDKILHALFASVARNFHIPFYTKKVAYIAK